MRPWRVGNPFWSTQHNLLSMAMALASVLLSGGRPLSGTSWALVFPLLLVYVLEPFVLKKFFATEGAREASSNRPGELSNGKAK